MRARLLTASMAAVLTAAALAGCGQSMDQQPRYDTYAKSDDGGSAARTPPAGTVRQSEGAYDAALATPPKVTPALLKRGQQRFDIFCAPCHGFDGAGDGIVVQRGFPAPPSYHSARLLAAPASHFMDVIQNGYGVMYPYGGRVEPADRWAIVAYIRALQLSRHATVAQAQAAGVTLR